MEQILIKFTFNDLKLFQIIIPLFRVNLNPYAFWLIRLFQNFLILTGFLFIF
jgi:hypothetical protein